MTAGARSPRLAGVGLALLSAACFGLMPVLTKFVYADGVNVVGLLAIRFTLGGLVLLGLARLRGERLPRGRTLLSLGVIGVLYVGQSMAFFSALERVSASLTSLLLYFYPAMVVVLNALVLRARPRLLVLVCVVVATIGTALTLGPLGEVEMVGVALGLASAVIYALYLIVSGRSLSTESVGPLAMSAVVMLFCGAFYDIVAVATTARLPSAVSAWLALGGVALFGTVIAVSAFFAALSRLGPSDTAVVSTFEPVVTVAVAAVVLGESLSPLQAVGGVMVLSAVIGLARTDPPITAGDPHLPA